MIDVAINAARLAGDLALTYFKSQPKVSYKPDNTPVTIADKKAELLIREIISQKYPDHGIIGEEFEPVNPLARFKWVIDPIDGTKNFIRNLPLWCTLLAVLDADKPIVGIAYYPFASEMFTAQKGKGAYLNGKRTRVSKIKSVNQAVLNHNSLVRIEPRVPLANFMKLYKAVQTPRNLGSYSYNQLLKGNIDIDIVGTGGIWDFAAPAILVEEAGGKFTDFSGKFSLTSNSAVFTNGLLHSQVLNLLN
ncbi:MAG: inositol monophosphatase [Candidatus Curtissbacteria bacterium]